jgi:hypothetical protein
MTRITIIIIISAVLAAAAAFATRFWPSSGAVSVLNLNGNAQNHRQIRA